MPEILTLSEAKLHCRIDGNDEDAAIGAMIDAAERAILDYLNLEELPDAPPVHAAALLLVGTLYANRESQSERPVVENRLFERLLAPYRVMEA